MLKIKVKEAGSIDKAIKQLRTKIRNTKQMQNLRSQKEFTKPSVKKRQALKKAIYRNQLDK